MIAADDVGAEDETQPENPKSKSRTPKQETTPRTPSRSEKAKRDAITPTRSGRSTEKSGEKTRDRNRSGSAPAKRVVSDAHWRKNRSPPRSTTSSIATNENTPAWALPDDGIRVKPISESKTKERQRRKPSPQSRSDEERKLNDERKAVKRESVSGEDEKNTSKQERIGEDDDGIRVYVTPPGSRRYSGHPRRRQSDHSMSEKGSGSDVEAPEASQPTEYAKRNKRSTPEKVLRISSSEIKKDPKGRRSSNQNQADSDDSPSARGAFSEGRASTRSHKGNFLSHIFGESRKSLTKQAQEPIPAPRVPSIEAWLSETPDPFVDAEEPPVEFVAPLRPSREKRKVTPQEEPVEDPNKIWEALDTKEGTRRAVTGSRRKKRVPSSAIYEDNPFPADFDSDSTFSGSGKGATSASKFIDLVQDAPKTSTSSLKRRSARKSVSSPVRDRRKSHTIQVSNEDEDTTSALSSNHTDSSVEGPDPSHPLKPRGLNIKRPFPSTGKHRLSTIASVETFSTRHGAAPPSVSEFTKRTIQNPTIGENEAAAEARDQFDPNS